MRSLNWSSWKDKLKVSYVITHTSWNSQGHEIEPSIYTRGRYSLLKVLQAVFAVTNDNSFNGAWRNQKWKFFRSSLPTTKCSQDWNFDESAFRSSNLV
ncbi:hypothetical protein M5689_024995 [Euphorbia peplus]|nr:hypothetical protein M5689_024995 [Euphorbia peplus]